MIETELSPIHALPSGLCEDPSGETASRMLRMGKADPLALIELYGMWSPTFLGIAYRMLGDRRAAEHLVQDTFVHIWNNSRHYDPHVSPPFVWAFAIMRDCCIDRFRSRQRAHKPITRIPSVQMHSPGDKSDNLRVMAMDDFRRVRAALDQLSSEERSSLESAVFLHFTHAEIPDHPGTSLGTQKNRLRQALKKVRNYLSRYEF